MLVPFAYLVLRAMDAEPEQLAELLFRPRNATLFVNTVVLAFGVLLTTSLISLPLAWVTSRMDVPFRRALTVLGVLPLAIPGYVMAFALLSATGGYGTLSRLIGVELVRPSGYWGSMFALSLATSPYLFLNLRSAIRGMDASLEESARALGYGSRDVFLRVILPQLRPAYLAGALLVGLHVLGDFGVVSLMRFETFSYAIYLQYASAFDRVYASWLALMLLVLTGGVLFLEARLLRNLTLHRTGSGVRREVELIPMGRWTVPILLFVTALILGIAIPVSSLVFWTTTARAVGELGGVLGAVGSSFTAAAPAAVLAGMLALPLAYLSVRMPSPVSAARRARCRLR